MPSERVQRQIDAFLDQAEEALREGAWDRAMERVRAVLDADPDNADAITFSGMVDAARGAESETEPSSAPDSADSSPTDQPTSFANGRYEVHRKGVAHGNV